MATALQDRIALVTGASSGIGRAVAAHLARHGACVVINHPGGEQAAAADAAVHEIAAAGGRALALRADVRSEDEVAALIAAIEQRFGRLDILINNAGIVRPAPLTELTLAAWDDVLDTNLRGAFLCIKHALPGMLRRDHGRIINTVSGLAFRGRAQCAAYCASKAGLLGLMRAAVAEIGARNVSVNCVAPTITWTPINEAGRNEERLREVRTRIPQQRAGTVDDLLPSYLFLAAQADAFFTGQCLAPNGGDVMA
ncbi:MAG: SDR family oxidoreductase [Burkholderiales bacterium]|nr:SDR family oxidoreductase [Burkholderiales bacterium]